MRPDVLWQWAFSGGCKLRHITNLEDVSTVYYCVDCGGPMVARRGQRRQWHYAHMAEPCAPRSDPDNHLHRLGVQAIVDGFRSAQRLGGYYSAGLRCPGCSLPIYKNLAEAGSQIETEKSVVPGTRSDIVVTDRVGGMVLIEVVNTHAPSDEAKRAFTAEGVVVLVVKVDWETLGSLKIRLLADYRLGRPTSNFCPNCRAANEAAMGVRMGLDPNSPSVKRAARGMTSLMRTSSIQFPLNEAGSADESGTARRNGGGKRRGE